jgi:hypothetical protein
VRISVDNARQLARLTVAGVLAAAILCCIGGAAQAATPAWKLLAVTGPSNLPPKQSEVERLTVGASGGTFILSREVKGAKATPVFDEASLGFVAGSPIATVESITGTGTIEPGDRVAHREQYDGASILSCSSDCTTPGSTIELSEPATATETGALRSIYTKELSGVTASFAVGEEILKADQSPGSTFPYFPPGTVVTNVDVAAGTIKLSNSTTFEYTSSEHVLELYSVAETAPILFDASADEVQSALWAAIGTGSVAVTGGPGGSGEQPYFIDYAGPDGHGPVADKAVNPLEADGSGLTGPAYANVLTTVPGGPGTGEIAIDAANIGGATTLGEYTVEVGPLPPGIVTTGPAVGKEWSCPGAAGETTVVCTSAQPVPRLNPANNLNLPIEIQTTNQDAVVPVTISGGGSAPASFQMPLLVSAEPAKPGIAAIWAGSFDENGKTVVQAGAHPYSADTFFLLNTIRSASGRINPVGDSRDVIVDLPPGFAGDPLATRRCPQASVSAPGNSENVGSELCNGPEMSIGRFQPALSEFGATTAAGVTVGILNDVPAKGYAAEFTTKIATPLQSLLGSVRSSEDYGIRITAPNNPNYARIYGSFAALEGFPTSAGGKAFLRNPTDCAETVREAPLIRAEFDTWQEPGEFWPTKETLPTITGCRVLNEAWLGQGPDPAHEAPSFSFRPATTQGSSPTGATADLHVPQEGLTAPDKLSTADLKKAVVSLPEGLTVNPSSANGLQSCSEDQVGYLGSNFSLPNPVRFDEEPVTCPDGSKLGTFDIKTPLLEEELHGTIYLAAQEENPFHSLIALYLVVDNERFGLHLKLPGEVRTDPDTGRLTAVFDYNPQVPFEELTLHFRGGGQRATLATPEVCGHYESTGSLEPWSSEDGEASPIHEGGFDTSSGCSSSASARPFSPSFEAGTTGTQAGAYSPLVIRVGRKDGEQELKSLDFTLPKGLVGKLAGITYCPESAIQNAESKSGKAEQASASCPSSSEIGSVDTSAGVGSEPIHVGGQVYLAGPYKGAPLSSVVVTPAVAGPFDLGDVVIRAPLYVNPETTEITAKSDPIPTILKGIPLKLRSVAITLDRSNFTLNPTSCNLMEVKSVMAGSSGATAKPADRFQVGGCKSLKFKPKVKISLKGATRRTGLPALKAVVTYPKKGAYANIRRAQVNLPHSEFLEQNNLNKSCTKPVLFEGKCPRSTIYGKAKAWTPLLDKPLEGPVYLVGGYGYKLPALVAELNGQIRVLLAGKTDSGPNRGIRNTFEAVPDAPVERFELQLKGGKKYGLLINSENLCKKPQKAIARFTAQNGLVAQTKPLVQNQCGRKKGEGATAKHKKN